MIHPAIQLRYIDDNIGYGVFATTFIPRGTIVYVKDGLEIEVSPEQYDDYPIHLRGVIDKYSYRDERGFRIISWDHAKYVNHCCQCNTMSTGYGFEIAIRDIQPGEQVTDEYGMFNIDQPMQLSCANGPCRGKVCASDLDVYYREWDARVTTAMADLLEVDQPLYSLIEPVTADELEAYLAGEADYRSVRSLRMSEGVAAPSSNGRHS